MFDKTISFTICIESSTEAKNKAKKVLVMSDLSSDEPALLKRRHKIEKPFSPASSTTSSCPLFGKVFNIHIIIFLNKYMPNN